MSLEGALTSKPVPISELCAFRVSAFSSPNVDALDAASSLSPLFATLTENTRGWGYPRRASHHFAFFPFHFNLPALFTLLAVSPERSFDGSRVEGSTACPVYPACRESRTEPRRERSRRVNRLSPGLFTNSHRIIFFAHPHPLTPIESYSCKNTRGGTPCSAPSFPVSPTHRSATHSSARLSRAHWARGKPFLLMGLLHSSLDTPGGWVPQTRSLPKVVIPRDSRDLLFRSGPRNTGHGTRVTHPLSPP